MSSRLSVCICVTSWPCTATTTSHSFSGLLSCALSKGSLLWHFHPRCWGGKRQQEEPRASWDGGRRPLPLPGVSMGIPSWLCSVWGWMLILEPLPPSMLLVLFCCLLSHFNKGSWKDVRWGLYNKQSMSEMGNLVNILFQIPSMCFDSRWVDWKELYLRRFLSKHTRKKRSENDETFHRGIEMKHCALEMLKCFI